MAYTLKGIAGQNYNQLSAAEQAQVQSAGEAAKKKYLGNWNEQYLSRIPQGTGEWASAENEGFEAAQRYAEGIFTARSDAQRLAERARETGTVTRGGANTIPNLQAQGQALLQGAAPAGSAADVLQKGISSGTVSATDPTAQFNASMQGNNTTAPGINAVAPIQAQMNAIQGGAKAPDDPSYQYNTQTGQPNPNFKGQVGAIPPTSTTSTTGTGASASDLAGQYSALLSNTSEVDAAQKAIDNQNNAARAGIQNIGEQPIAMPFISGQQADIEKRNTNLQIPLQQQLANAQQRRQASLDAVKFQLERSDKETDRQDKLAKEKTDEAYRQAVLAETKRNNTLDSQKTTGAGVGGSTGTFTGTLSPLAQAVQNGTIALDKIPIAQRSAVAAELATSGIDSVRQQTLSANLSAVNSLLNNPAIEAISGVPALTAFLPGTQAQLAKNQYNQVKGILSLENREKLKGSGAISDFEFKVLAEAATALGRNLSDKDFKAQLQKIKEVFEGKYATTNAGSGKTSSEGVTPSGVKYKVTK